METRLRELRDKPRPAAPKGYTLNDVAEGVAEWFRANGIERGATTSQISKLERGETPLTNDWMRAFSAFYEVPISDLFADKRGSAGSVSLVGYIGAGSMYYPDAIAGPWKGFEEVAPPPGAEGFIAVRVRGNSMSPVYRDGDLLFFAGRRGAEIEPCVGRDCIVQTRGGPAYLKRVERNKHGKLVLISYDGAEKIEDPNIEWVSPVKWTMRA